MQRVFEGMSYNLPYWVRWITVDRQGEIWAWEYKPCHAHNQWNPVYSPPNYTCQREYLGKLDEERVPVLDWEKHCYIAANLPEPAVPAPGVWDPQFSNSPYEELHVKGAMVQDPEMAKYIHDFYKKLNQE